MFRRIVLGIFLLFAAVSSADRANAQQSDHSDGIGADRKPLKTSEGGENDSFAKLL
jgi:hypothetical protein